MVKNIGKEKYKVWKRVHANDVIGPEPFKFEYSMCKSVFNVWNTRMVYYLLLYRVYYALAPAPQKFKIFFENKTDQQLKDIIFNLYQQVWNYIVKKGRIQPSDGERIRSIGDLDVINNELDTLFKVENNKLIEIKTVHCGKRSRDIYEPQGDGWDGFRLRNKKRRRIDMSHSSAPLDPTTIRDIEMTNNMADMVRSSHSQLLREIRQMNGGMNADDTVDEMIANPKRGMRHFSNEWKDYHLTKSEIYGFQLIAEELSSKSISSGERQRYFNHLINTNGKSRRKQQLREIQGKLGLHPFVYSVVCVYRERYTVPKFLEFGEDYWALILFFTKVVDTQL